MSAVPSPPKSIFRARNLWLALALLVLGLLVYTLIKAELLIWRYERNTSALRSLQPAGSAFTISKTSENGGLRWELTATRGQGNLKKKQASAEDIELLLFDAQARPQLRVLGERGFVNQAEKQITLTEGVKIRPVNSSIELSSKQLTLAPDETVLLEGQVYLWLNQATGEYLHARSASLEPRTRELAFEGVLPSPVAADTTITSGRMTGTLTEDNQLTQVFFSGGVQVSLPREQTEVQAAKMTLQLGANNQPRRAIFVGDPRARQRGQQLSASRLSYDFAARQLTANGKVKLR